VDTNNNVRLVGKSLMTWTWCPLCYWCRRQILQWYHR
jgi:hypothetical protein